MRTSRRDRAVLLLSGMLVRLACRRLPASTRDEWIREWTSELPAILNDTEVRSWLARAASTVLFAVDQQRSTLALASTNWWRVLGRYVAAAVLTAAFASSFAIGIGVGVGKYLISGGDSGAVSNAKNIVIYGLCISVIAYPLVGLVYGLDVMALLVGMAGVLNVVSFGITYVVGTRPTQAPQQRISR